MILRTKNILKTLALTVAVTALFSCNKEFENIKESANTQPQGKTAGELIESDAGFSILKAAVDKAGLMNILKNSGSKLTVFAPDDAAFTASGLSLAVVNAMPAPQLQALLSYHIIPQALPSAQIATTFPNMQMPTLLALPVGNPLVKMSIFPSRRASAVYANNIPVKQADIAVANGVVHKVAALVAPPEKLIAQIVYADPELSFFRAAVARGDEGQTGLNRLDSVMKFGLANVTVFAPTNTAFKQMLTAMGYPAEESTIAMLPVETVRGIVAYHMLGVRAFSVNMPATATNIPTLLNGAIPNHPGITVQATFAGPVTTDIKLTGLGNHGMPATVITKDLNAVNGIVHKIDMVLMPQ